MTDAETGGRHPHPKRRESESRVSQDGGISPILRRLRQSNVQLPAEIPIAVAVIGICPITRNSVARQPNREGRRKSHRRRTAGAFGPDPLPRMPALLLDGCFQTALETRSIADGRLDAIRTSLPSANSFTYGWFARRLYIHRKSEERSRLSPTPCWQAARERAPHPLSLQTPTDGDRLVGEPGDRDPVRSRSSACVMFRASTAQVFSASDKCSSAGRSPLRRVPTGNGRHWHVSSGVTKSGSTSNAPQEVGGGDALFRQHGKHQLQAAGYRWVGCEVLLAFKTFHSSQGCKREGRKRGVCCVGEQASRGPSKVRRASDASPSTSRGL